eukprot:UN18537
MPDGWEVTHKLNPQTDDANMDADNDGINNLAEYQAGTNPNPDENDATLSGLSVSDISLTPAFDPSQYNYSSTETTSAVTITVTAVVSDTTGNRLSTELDLP